MMTMPEIDPRLISLAAFFKRHSPGLRHWPRSALVPMLEWYWRDARVGIVQEHGKIVAAATARCLHHTGESRDAWAHDEHAPIVWIEDIASRHPRGLAALLGLLTQRFGERTALAGAVFKRDGEQRMFPYSIINRLAQTTQ